MSTPRAAARVGSCLLLVALTACQPRSVAFTAHFVNPETRDASRAVFLRILEGGCSGRTVYASSFPTSDPESAAPVPVLARGTYAFEIEARDADCNVVARICTTRELPLEQSELVIDVPDQAPSPACEAAQCSNGTCSTDVPPDAGPPDEDAGPVPCGGDGECPGGRCRDGVCCYGCWDGSSCQAGTAVSACGVEGGDCNTCTATQSCEAGACTTNAAGASLALSAATSYVRIAGGLWSAGKNDVSQRGELRSATADVFAQQDTDIQFIDVAATQLASCGIDVDGSLHCWGQNQVGLLGINETDLTVVHPTPQAVPSGSMGWRAVEGGDLHFCAIREDERLFCWGNNMDGQLGSAGSFARAPTEIDAGGTWRAVSPGAAHTCAIRTDGALFCWGSADDGRLGSAGATGGAEALQVGSATDWSAVSAGVRHTCGVRSAAGGRELFCWGSQEFGRLGNGVIDPASIEEPISIDAANEWADVEAGQYHGCARTEAGDVYCWGVGAPTGLPSEEYVPTMVPLDITASSIAVGWSHTCAVALDGGAFSALRCWGSGMDGKLGTGGTGDESEPTTPTLEPAP